LGLGFISARAADNPAQAASRAALLQKLNDLDHPRTLVLPAPVRVLVPVEVSPDGIVVKHQRRMYA
jgi:hypothetical protein